MLERLTARSFRNLEPVDWQVGPGSHLLLGDNGAGKTSLLEALYVLTTTRSFRTAQLADCCRIGEKSFFLTGDFRDEARARLELSWGPDGLARTLDGGGSSLADHLAVQPIVAWTAADSELVTGAPELRRRFLDRGILGLRPQALAALSRYRRALGQKRALLASGGGDPAPWNAVLAAAAAELIALRRDYVERLSARLAELLAGGGLPFERVDLDYRPSPPAGLEGEAACGEAFERVAGEERRQRRPALGPHRDELVVRWQGRSVRKVVSAGESKALGMLLTAAHGRVLEAAGRRPLYLLDDADAELSATTLAALWRVFESAGQLFLSSNRPAVWSGLAIGSAWQLQRGVLGPADAL